MASALLDRLALPVPGDDLLTPFLDRVPPVARTGPGRGSVGAGRGPVGAGRGPVGWPLPTLSGQRPRYEPRNLDFADGLSRWDLDAGFRPAGEPSRDYSAAAEGPSAVLSSAIAWPSGSAALVQAVFADDYRGATVVFRGDIRTERLTQQAGLRLEILRYWWRVGRAREDHAVTVSGGRHQWTSCEITALIPQDSEIIRSASACPGRAVSGSRTHP
jgi:hypothetical protein